MVADVSSAIALGEYSLSRLNHKAAKLQWPEGGKRIGEQCKGRQDDTESHFAPFADKLCAVQTFLAEALSGEESFYCHSSC